MRQLVAVSMQELDRMKCIEAVVEGSLTPIRAAERLGLTTRQVRRLATRISTAHVESVMNHLVNHRLSKKRQLRWSPEGAHYLLQVRAELLNGTLTDAYRVANPRFRGTSGFAQAVH